MNLNGTTQQKESRILILSDSVLSCVKRKGLSRTVEYQPASGTNIDTVSEKLQVYGLTKFSDIVIYVVGNDSSNNTDVEYFEEKCEQLLQYIKGKNQTCQITFVNHVPGEILMLEM